MKSRLCKVSRPPEFAVSFHKSNENILPLSDFNQTTEHYAKYIASDIYIADCGFCIISTTFYL